jgi:benzoyl-CoA reductase/2-hydroxyglutaryl-CoA dehydratase subunit BcrC/BadD/HgdB
VAPEHDEAYLGKRFPLRRTGNGEQISFSTTAAGIGTRRMIREFSIPIFRFLHFGGLALTTQRVESRIQLIHSLSKDRLGDLLEAKRRGQKIIGYPPGGYMPEELVLACGGIPLCLLSGGEHSAVELAGAYICRWIDPFYRAQIGYAVSGDDPYYNVIDLLVVPVTDNHVRAMMDVIDYHSPIEIFPFGVPHTKEEMAFAYYLHGLRRLKKKLEDITGTEITETRLRSAIDLCNRERQLLRDISVMRKSDRIPLSGREFVALNHASFVGDKPAVVRALEAICEELKMQYNPVEQRPRVLLTGSTLAIGDNKIIDLIEEAGGVIAVEEFAEGMKPYWEMVAPEGDLMEALADCYFRRRIPPAWFRPGRERLDFLIHLAEDYRVNGVIWYALLYRESYKTESYYFPAILKKKTGLPMLTLESEYDTNEIGPLRTRVETFIEMIRN